jgi:hypothetical protein
MKTKEYPDDFELKYTGIVECSDGHWFAEEVGMIEIMLNGKHHNENGPAVIHTNGKKIWFLDGEYFLTEFAWKIELEKCKSMRNLISL